MQGPVIGPHGEATAPTDAREEGVVVEHLLADGSEACARRGGKRRCAFQKMVAKHLFHAEQYAYFSALCKREFPYRIRMLKRGKFRNGIR